MNGARAIWIGTIRVLVLCWGLTELWSSASDSRVGAHADTRDVPLVAHLHTRLISFSPSLAPCIVVWMRPVSSSPPSPSHCCCCYYPLTTPQTVKHDRMLRKGEPGGFTVYKWLNISCGGIGYPGGTVLHL